MLPTGLTADGLKVVKSTLDAGVNLAGVNVMAMDYGESAAPTSGPSAKTMGAYAIDSASPPTPAVLALQRIRQDLRLQPAGRHPMIGVNDITTEVFTAADAQTLENYARSKGLGMLGFWSATRDVPGALGQATRPQPASATRRDLQQDLQRLRHHQHTRLHHRRWR